MVVLPSISKLTFSQFLNRVLAKVGAVAKFVKQKQTVMLADLPSFSAELGRSLKNGVTTLRQAGIIAMVCK